MSGDRDDNKETHIAHFKGRLTPGRVVKQRRLLTGVSAINKTRDSGKSEVLAEGNHL